MRSRIQLGKFLGISLQIDPSWFIVFFLILFSLSTRFSEEHPHWGSWTTWTVGLLTSVLFFVSVVLHELAHSIVALAKGIPVRSITLFIFGGVAQIGREARRPGTEFLVAVAGPAASFFLSALFLTVWMFTRESNEVAAVLSLWLGQMNLALAVFNLIPGFPLDGGRILRSIIWAVSGNFHTASKAATTMGRIVAYLFIIGGIITALQSDFFSGLWIGFIGWFLLNAAQQSYAHAVLINSLVGIRASDLMTRDCPRVAAKLSLNEFVNDYLFRTGRHCFLVMDQDLFQGIITLHEVNKIPRERWNEVMLSEVMVRLENLRWVTPQQDVLQILESMDRENINQVPVIEEGRLLGMVGRQEILHVLQNRLNVSA
ncbi:MAG: site-2 protease family protein [Acidobacteriota bacterium]